MREQRPCASYIARLKEKWIDWQFMNGTLSTTRVAVGTAWTSTSLYSDDWGEALGVVIRYGYPSVVGEGC
jgi:hypothetical protein